MTDVVCQCGCGQLAPVVRGVQKKRIPGHEPRGEHHPLWRGGAINPRSGYRYSRTEIKGLHVIEVERVLGKPLPRGAVVHHANGDRADNRHSNLVACQDSAYHNLLHLRERAKRATGHADYRRCPLCHKWDAPANLRFSGRNVRHRVCANAEARKRRAMKALPGLEAK